MKRHKERSRYKKDRDDRQFGFRCSHCRQWVVVNEWMGTANRNHCNLCLWSKHVDIKKGDRMSDCLAGMRPVAVTFRIEDKIRRGEVMLVHACTGCDKLSVNRIAADDLEHVILEVLDKSFGLAQEPAGRLRAGGIEAAGPDDRPAVMTALFGA
jgi:hypothetical protein